MCTNDSGKSYKYPEIPWRTPGNWTFKVVETIVNGSGFHSFISVSHGSTVFVQVVQIVYG